MKVFWRACERELDEMKPVNENYYKMLHLKTSIVTPF